MIEELITKLEKSYLFDRRYNTVFTVVETLLGIVAGVYIKATVSDFTIASLLLSILFSVLLLCLVFRRTYKQEHFSLSGLGELKATINLKNAQKDIERKSLIDTYIDEAIINLNSNTCDYLGSNVEEHLCDQSVENGLKSMYKPFISNTPNLLDVSTAKFTVGAYLDYYCTLPPDVVNHRGIPNENKNTFLLKDDLSVQEFIVPDMLSNPDVKDEGFEIQRHLLNGFKHKKFIETLIQHNGKAASLICAPIPDVCDFGSFGVFFIIGDPLKKLPDDLENLMVIFGRLFSNWLVRYNECVRNRCAQGPRKPINVAVVKQPEGSVDMANLKTIAVNELQNRTIGWSAIFTGKMRENFVT